MTDLCSVKRATGHTTQDEDTGKEVAEFQTRFSSRCKVQVSSVSLSIDSRFAHGVAATAARAEVHFPASTTGIEIGDLVEVTVLGSDSMPTLSGRKFRVTGFNPKTHGTVLKVEVEDVL